MTDKKDDKTSKENKNIPTPHDLFFKTSLEDKDRAKKHIQTHFSKNIVRSTKVPVMNL